MYAWEPAIVADLLCTDPSKFTPSGFSGIAMALRHVFGSEAIPDWQVLPVAYEEYMGKSVRL